MGKPHVSPSRTYVAFCNNTNWDGHYFIRFVLPEKLEISPFDLGFTSQKLASEVQPAYQPLENNAEVASWYFLNHLNSVACIEKCITAEDFSCLRDNAVDYGEHMKMKEIAKKYHAKYGSRAFEVAVKIFNDPRHAVDSNEEVCDVITIEVLKQLARMP